MTPEEYQAKRQARYERLLSAAERAERESKSASSQAHDMASVIPFGQPILVGHHSEGRDRRYRARIENKFRKGYELHVKAKALKSRAEAALRNTTIFSDDPAAIEKLEDKIARLEERQRLMVEANKLVRKNDREGLAELGFSDGSIELLFTPDFAGRIGFADYQLTNNSANIRRLKERVKKLVKHSEDETTEKRIGAVTIVDNVEDNRIQMFFTGKPREAIRTELKSHGFRWSPTNGCWQAYRGSNAMFYAEKIATQTGGENPS